MCNRTKIYQSLLSEGKKEPTPLDKAKETFGRTDIYSPEAAKDIAFQDAYRAQEKGDLGTDLTDIRFGAPAKQKEAAAAFMAAYKDNIKSRLAPSFRDREFGKDEFQPIRFS